MHVRASFIESKDMDAVRTQNRVLTAIQLFNRSRLSDSFPSGDHCTATDLKVIGFN